MTRSAARFRIYPILALLAYLLGTIRGKLVYAVPEVSDLIFFAGCVLAGSLSLLRILSARLKDESLASFCGILLLFPILHYADLYRLLFENTWLGVWVLESGGEQFHLTLIILLLLAGISAFLLIRRWPGFPGVLAPFLVIFFSAVAILEIILILRYQPREIKWEAGKPNKIPPRSIVYIVPDGLASSASLRNHWNYPDTGFTNGLKKLGFQIPLSSRVNYNSTLLSVGSALHMNYANIESYQDLNKTRVQDLIESVRQSWLPRWLKEKGWSILNYSPFPLVNEAAFYEEPFHLKTSLWNRTIFYSIANRMGWTQERKQLEDLGSINACLPDSALAEIRRIQGHYFCYVHLMLPHYPYFFDRQGERRPDAEAMNHHASIHKYLEQVQFTYVLLLKFVCELQKLSDPPVILLQSDHGFRSLKDIPYPDQVDESLNNFAAIYSPDTALLRRIPDTLSPVNSFRWMFPDARMLPNRHYNTELDPEHRE